MLTDFFISLFFSVLFIQFWLCWVFVIAQAFLSLRQARAPLQLRCVDFLLWWLLLQRTGSRVLRLQQLHCAGSVVMAHRLICPVACGIFPNQASNLCLLHWQMDSLPLRHQGSPYKRIFKLAAAAAAATAKSLQSCLTVRPQRWQPTRLPCPRDSPGKNTGVGYHFLLHFF